MIVCTLLQVTLLQSKVSELASENAELKSNLHDRENKLSEQITASKIAHASKQEMEMQIFEMKERIGGLEQSNSKLRNEV